MPTPTTARQAAARDAAACCPTNRPANAPAVRLLPPLDPIAFDLSVHDLEILHEADQILLDRFIRLGAFVSPNGAKDWLRVHCATQAAEVFGVILLDNKNRIITVSELFRGSIDGCAVQPREIARLVLSTNAAACIFWHGHPSGCAEPSQADIALTRTLKNLLSQLDVRVLDHLIAGSTVISMVERGVF